MNQTTMTAVGTLITAPELRHTLDGTPVTSFRIACNERRLDRESGLWVDRDTLYSTVTCWRRLAENICASFRTGDPIIVRGRIYTRSYDKDGRRNAVTEIEADVVGPDVSRCTISITRRRPSSTVPAGTDTASAAADPADGAGAAAGDPTWSPVPDDASAVIAAEEALATEEMAVAGR